MKERSKFLLALCKGMKHAKLLTLTMPRWTTEPKQGIRFIRASFMKLRRTKLFRKIRGGAYQVELIKKPDGWHIHIHVLFDGPFIPHQWIFTQWGRIIGVAVPQIDVRAASDPGAQVYVCKYASKSASFDASIEDIVDWYIATKGQRLFGTFGEWYNKKLIDIAPELCPPVAPRECPNCHAEHTTFLARDGPFIYGWLTWKEIAPTFGADGAWTRDIQEVKKMLEEKV